MNTQVNIILGAMAWSNAFKYTVKNETTPYPFTNESSGVLKYHDKHKITILARPVESLTQEELQLY